MRPASAPHPPHPWPLVRALALAALAGTTALAGCAHAPARLGSSAELLGALGSGRAVRAIVRYARCTLTVDGKTEPSPDAIGGLEASAFEHFARGVVHNERAYTAFSEARTIVHPRYGAVENYARLRVYEDGEVEVSVKYLEPPAKKVVMDETFTCRLGDAVELFAAD